jgi:predicted transcriptional regulator
MAPSAHKLRMRSCRIAQRCESRVIDIASFRFDLWFMAKLDLPPGGKSFLLPNSAVNTVPIHSSLLYAGRHDDLLAGSVAVMNSENTAKNVDLRPVTKIIASYVGNHTLAPDQLSALIISVQQTLRDLGKPAPLPAPRTPAVPIKRSVQRDQVVCLECGFRGKTLRRHLGTRHGLQIAEYLRRWDLASDHPLTAPAYSEQRSTMAKELGLGRARSRPRGRARRAKA